MSTAVRPQNTGLAELRPDDGGAGAVQQTVEYRQQYRPSHPQAVLIFLFSLNGYNLITKLISRAGRGPQTFFAMHSNQLPSLSGVHGLKDFLCSDHLLESFDGRNYSLKHFHKSKFVQQRTQEEEHYRGNP